MPLAPEAARPAPMSALPLEDAFPEAVHTFKQWLGAAPRDERCVVFCHFDADGLAAGALFGRGLEFLGFTDVVVVPSGRDESAFSEAARQRLAALQPASLVVADLGVNERGTLEASGEGASGAGGVPVLYVDHHRPSGAPEAAYVVSAYDWEPIPCSAWLAYGLLEAAAPDVDELREADWIAAVGVISDLGEKAPWPLMADAKRRHTAKWLKEATVLVNAARRASTFQAQAALDLLMQQDGPRALAESPEAEPLHRARAEVHAEMAEARKAAPVFSEGEPFALVRVHSACQVHPLIAQQWRTRLPAYAVICANTGYLDGTVAFSARTAREDLPLPERFQAIDTPGWNGRWGHGHDQASGGHLPPAVFDDVLDALGFPPEAHVSSGACLRRTASGASPSQTLHL